MEYTKKQLVGLKRLLQEEVNTILNKYSDSKKEDKIVLDTLRSCLK